MQFMLATEKRKNTLVKNSIQLIIYWNADCKRGELGKFQQFVCAFLVTVFPTTNRWIFKSKTKIYVNWTTVATSSVNCQNEMKQTHRCIGGSRTLEIVGNYAGVNESSRCEAFNQQLRKCYGLFRLNTIWHNSTPFRYNLWSIRVTERQKPSVDHSTVPTS